MKNTDPAENVSAFEAARQLGMDRSTIVRWLQQNRMAGFRTPGGQWRIPRTELERILATK